MYRNRFVEIAKKVLPTSVNNFILNKMTFLKRPKNIKSVISDQFPFRNGEWRTYFELLNLPMLFDPINSREPYNLRIVFFDQDGHVIHAYEELKNSAGRITLDLNTIFPSIPSVGTFSCFHNYYSDWLANENAFLAERGYVGYENIQFSKTKGYVHGNFDAIAEDYNGTLKSLGTSSIIKRREYRLQHELNGKARYEFVFVNSTNSVQKLNIDLHVTGRSDGESKILVIPSRGVRIFEVAIVQDQTANVKINSYLDMARPVVFRITEDSFDVFHG
jgi:hypothetical protein